jgi:hypothetical protein
MNSLHSRRRRPMQNHVERCRAIAGPRLIRVRSMCHEELERRRITGCRGEGQGNTIVGVGSGLEQEFDQR